MNEADWAERRILKKLGSNLGWLNAADISEGFSLSQRFGSENTGPGASATKSLLSLHLPGAQEIKATASLDIFSRLQPFDGPGHFPAPSDLASRKIWTGTGVLFESIKDTMREHHGGVVPNDFENQLSYRVLGWR